MHDFKIRFAKTILLVIAGTVILVDDMLEILKIGSLLELLEQLFFRQLRLRLYVDLVV